MYSKLHTCSFFPKYNMEIAGGGDLSFAAIYSNVVLTKNNPVKSALPWIRMEAILPLIPFAHYHKLWHMQCDFL